MELTIKDLTTGQILAGDAMKLETYCDHQYEILSHDDTLYPGETNNLTQIRRIIGRANEAGLTRANLRALSNRYTFNELLYMAHDGFADVVAQMMFSAGGAA